MQNEFVNIAAHEFRTPTQAIVEYSETLEQSPERNKYYEDAIFRRFEFESLNSTIMSSLVMLSVTCRHVGVDCDFKGTSETEEELMNNLVEHGIKDHGYTREYVMNPELQEKIKTQIKKS